MFGVTGQRKETTMAKYEIIEDLLYTNEHEWIRKIGDDIVEIGISAYAAGELGDLVYAEAEPEDTELSEGDIIGSVESVKMASDVFSPVNGTIVEANEDIEDEPESINESPYETWIVKVKLDDASELDELMDAAEYEKFLDEEA